MKPGSMRERVAFDVPVHTPDGSGGQTRTWSEIETCGAEFRYERGREAVQSGGQTGTATFKVKIRSSQITRSIGTQHRMRDVRRSMVFNIREVDAISDLIYVWLVCEKGVAI